MSQHITSICDALAEIEQQIDFLFEMSAFGVYVTTDEGACSSINNSALKWIGCTRESIIGKKAPDDAKAAVIWNKFQEYSDKLQAQGLGEIEVDLDDSNGNRRFFHFLSRSTTFPGPASRTRRSQFFNITQQKRANEHKRIAALAFESQIGLCVANEDGLVLEINGAFSKITGFSRHDLRDKPFDLILSLQSNAQIKMEMRNSLMAEGQWEGEIRDKKRNGSNFVGWMNITAVKKEDDFRKYYVVSLYDITESTAIQDEIYNLAYFDALTQLPNRRKLNDRLARILSVIPRSHLHGALLFIDLDNFKALNDTKGHAVGDLLLIEVGNRLQRAVRDGDMVARIGGDEFVVLLPELSAYLGEASYQANLIGSKILKTMAVPYVLEDFGFNCSASIGIALFGQNDQPAEVFQHADMAMYQAKKDGRNSLCFFDPSLKATAEAYAVLEQELVRAIELNQLELFYQPQFDFHEKVLSVEALLRWHHPHRGLVVPNEFIPIAEESGLIVPIGFWALQSACNQIKRWQSDTVLCKLVVSVNVSPRQFKDPDFFAKVSHAIESSGVNPSSLKIELTERVMHDVEHVGITMGKLRELGIKFSLDDFGTGYSSLTSLIKLPLDQLKIDRSFVKNMLSNPADEIVVKTIVGMACSLGLDVIAEGVETQEEKIFLNKHGCSRYQGHLLCPPLSCGDFQNFARKRHQSIDQ